MPARSRSQQRLFAMVHAYNKGELHCGRSLRKRVADLAGRISDDDARDFARTKHDGLPERKEEKSANALAPAIFSRDVLAGSSPARVLRDSDGLIQVIGPRGNNPADVSIVAEKEVSPLLAAWYARHRSKTPSDADLRRMYDIVQADARLFRRLKALGLVDSVRAGRSVRNRIVHQPGYVPSEADARRAMRDYYDAERKTEKKAQVMVRPETMQALYAQVPVGEYAGAAIPASVRSERRRSFLGSVLYGTGAGAILGGLGAAGLGAFIANHAARESGLSDTDVRSRMLEAAAKLGLWGAGRGAIAGSAVGAGLGVLDKVRG